MFPLSRWSTPAISGLGRLPMAPARPPYDDVEAARSGAVSPWVRSLDGRWSVRIRDRLDDVGLADVSGPTDGWDHVVVPGTWALQRAGRGHGAPIYLNIRMPFDGQPPHVPDDNPTAVHRRTFTVPASWRRDRRTHLRVGAADSMGFVWVNGGFVGFGTDSHLASTYDITDLVTAGRNDVCLVVPRWSAATWIEDQDQWWLPGLHRSVELVSVPPVHLADSALVPGLAADGTTGTIDLDVRVGGADARTALTVELFVDTLTGRHRRVLRTDPIEVPRWRDDSPNAEVVSGYLWPGARLERRLQVPDIEPWHHESPTRYRATVVLRDRDGDVLDVRTTVVGFRRVEVTAGALLVNGVPVVINGVNRHEIHPDRARSLTVDDVRRDLEPMKRHHVNAVRTAHYPNDESLYDLCDELGLYVIDEADIETHARWAAMPHDASYAAAFLERGLRMVLRDRSHPCVIAWSLGNESGDGPAHDAMAGWIRRVDPSRPVQYEGGFTLDLDAANPVSDLVCPMYTPVERIVQWSREGRDQRRPLILCEYGHAMGQAGGLDDYWAVFGVERGLQGGFVWEWCDHALRCSSADGSTWLAHGGDFGEADHDGSFVCDGLVSADREPHPLLAELAALTQPVTTAWATGRRLRVTNRRWFRDLSDLEARWSLTVEGRSSGRGTLAVVADARQSVSIDPPPEVRAALEGNGRVELTVSFRPRRNRRPAWADAGWVAATCQLVRPGRRSPSAFTTGQPPAAADEDGISMGALHLPWPELSLWRAPTSNDDPPGAWRPGPPPARSWRELGLDRLTPLDVAVGGRRTDVHRSARYVTTTGVAIEHRQTLRAAAGRVELLQDIRIDPSLCDLPRVGVRLTLPAGFEILGWRGPGPGSTYPDRRTAGLLGTFTSTVSDQQLPFVVPQEHGLHLDTSWLSVASARAALVVEAAAGRDRFAWSALHHTVEDLTATTHAHLVPERPETFVHLDLAHRGLGSFACGPDTHDRHRIHGGRYRATWRLAVLGS